MTARRMRAKVRVTKWRSSDRSQSRMADEDLSFPYDLSSVMASTIDSAIIVGAIVSARRMASNGWNTRTATQNVAVDVAARDSIHPTVGRPLASDIATPLSPSRTRRIGDSLPPADVSSHATARARVRPSTRDDDVRSHSYSHSKPWYRRSDQNESGARMRRRMARARSTGVAAVAGAAA